MPPGRVEIQERNLEDKRKLIPSYLRFERVLPTSINRWVEGEDQKVRRYDIRCTMYNGCEKTGEGKGNKREGNRYRYVRVQLLDQPQVQQTLQLRVGASSSYLHM